MLVFGGSLGARTINRAAVEAFTGSAFRVLHIAGSREYAELAARQLPPGYDLRDYLDEADFADALAAADLAVSRAGGSLFELAAHGVPAILVPYPHAAADHQGSNARWMADAGAAVVIADSELGGERLAHQVAELLADRSRLSAMAASSRAHRAPRRRPAGSAYAAGRREPMSSAAAPWAGRRLHFVGVGGAGMSGYARAARGARRAGQRLRRRRRRVPARAGEGRRAARADRPRRCQSARR